MKNHLVIWLLKLQSILPLSACRRFAVLLAACIGRTNSRMLRTTRTNLQICFPGKNEGEREALVRTSLRESCKTFMEGGAVWLWPAEKTLGLIREVENEEALSAAVAAGKGVLVISPHLGNWEIIGLWLGQCGHAPSVQLYQAPRNPLMDRLLYRARSRSGAIMVNTDTRGVAALLKALRRGEISGILPDQVPDESGGEYTPFFGRPALTMTLVSRLVHKTGCRVLLAYVSRIESTSQSGFKLSFREVDSRLYAEDTATSLIGLNATVEAAILEAPELYHWEYKRFRRQPAGMDKPY